MNIAHPYKTLSVVENQCGITVTLNRPQVRNALNQLMIHELSHLMRELHTHQTLRVMVIRGAQGHFCAGADITDMLTAASTYEAGNTDAFYELNLSYGQLLVDFARLPCTTLAIVEGTVMGGGLGLAAVADICIAGFTAKFGMPETSLGLPPAQIAPFVAERIGLAQTRRIALTARKLSAQQAKEIGLVDQVAATEIELEKLLSDELNAVTHCSPKALRATKQLLLNFSRFSPDKQVELTRQLHEAAQQFSIAITQGDGPEGTQAFIEKRKPSWATTQAL